MDYRSPYGRSNSLPGTGSRLQRMLWEQGVSKEELARRSGVSRSTVYRICGGDAIGSLETWRKIADALGCSISEITQM